MSSTLDLGEPKIEQNPSLGIDPLSKNERNDSENVEFSTCDTTQPTKPDSRDSGIASESEIPDSAPRHAEDRSEDVRTVKPATPEYHCDISSDSIDSENQDNLSADAKYGCRQQFEVINSGYYGDPIHSVIPTP